MANNKLTPLQNGILQKIVSISVGLLSFALVYWNFHDVYNKGLLSRELAYVTTLAVFVSFSTFIAITQTTKMNLVLPVILPKVIEFSKALQEIHVNTFEKQILYLAEKKINIYFTSKPILRGIEENIKVRKYIALVNTNILKAYNGDKRLCLDFDNYKELLHEQEQFSTSAYAAKISELEQERDILKANNSLLHDNISNLTQENSELNKVIIEFKAKQQTSLAREGKAEKREHERIVFWRVAIPTINRLLEEATSETQYTRPQIQTAFEEELENFPDLKPAIAILLETPKKKEEGKLYDLDGWGMDFIRRGLGDHIKK